MTLSLLGPWVFGTMAHFLATGRLRLSTSGSSSPSEPQSPPGSTEDTILLDTSAPSSPMRNNSFGSKFADKLGQIFDRTFLPPKRLVALAPLTHIDRRLMRAMTALCAASVSEDHSGEHVSAILEAFCDAVVDVIGSSTEEERISLGAATFARFYQRILATRYPGAYQTLHQILDHIFAPDERDRLDVVCGPRRTAYHLRTDLDRALESVYPSKTHVDASVGLAVTNLFSLRTPTHALAFMAVPERHPLSWPALEVFDVLGPDDLAHGYSAPAVFANNREAEHAELQKAVVSAYPKPQSLVENGNYLPLCMVGFLKEGYERGEIHNEDRWWVASTLQDLGAYDIEDTVDLFQGLARKRFETRHAEHIRNHVRAHPKKQQEKIQQGYGPLVSPFCASLQKPKSAESDRILYKCPFSEHASRRGERTRELLRIQKAIDPNSDVGKSIVGAADRGDAALACKLHYEALARGRDSVRKIYHPVQFVQRLAMLGGENE